jgi:Cof subfamily protein (haloacid dehalogenase superfamily)
LNFEIAPEDFDLIVFDINGTLAEGNAPIHSFTKQTLRIVSDLGVSFTLATGLNLISAQPFADELEVDLPLVLSNGAIIETRQGDISFRAVIPIEAVNGIIRICEEQNQDLVIYIDNDIYIQEMSANILHVYSHVLERVIAVADWIQIDDQLSTVNKMLVANITSGDELDRIGQVIQEQFGDFVDVVRSSDSLVEMMPNGVNKAEGLRRLSEILSIPLDRIMAFGDYDNDAEMLAAVGIGIAVENATGKAKAAADHIVPSVADNGPARFLRKIYNLNI